MELTEDQWEELKDAIDTLDNIKSALVHLTTLSDKVHVDALRETIPRTLARFQAIVEQVEPSP